MRHKRKMQEFAAAPEMVEGQAPVFRGQQADVSSKRIFGNHTLCAQFLFTTWGAGNGLLQEA